MEACAENNKQLIILDRPNPNGFYVDGPILEKGFTSFVGMHPVPIVHGMTIGEYALMINGEGWLSNAVQCNLKVIPCKNYEHTDYYQITIPPSPNLRTMHAIALYPALCLLEGTNVSVGRGTDAPFEVIGSPGINETGFSFTPVSKAGAKNPPFLNQLCHGYDLRTSYTTDSIEHQLNLQYLVLAYESFIDKNNFFLANHFFNKLAGNVTLKEQLIAGLSEEEIRLSWQEGLLKFKQVRKKYLLYTDFEE